MESQEAVALVRELVRTSADSFIQANRLHGPTDWWSFAHHEAKVRVLKELLGREPTRDEINAADIG
jgi:hypothetical protein